MSTQKCLPVSFINGKMRAQSCAVLSYMSSDTLQPEEYSISYFFHFIDVWPLLTVPGFTIKSQFLSWLRPQFATLVDQAS